jgi:hypothetical protein
MAMLDALENRIAYLRGLADGLDVGSSAEGKMMAEIIDILDDMHAEIHVLHTRLEETEDYIEAIDEDLGDIELFLFDDDELLYETVEEDDAEAYTYESMDTELDEDQFDTSYEFTCPSCQKGIKLHEGMDDEGYLHYVIEPYDEKAGHESINPT